jgi:ParB family transcriptional regulator, chromosome partitioning protein
VAKNAKGGLGKGFATLINESSIENGGEEIFELPTNMIVPNPDQPRVEFDEASLQELADSIKKHGLLQPILVRPEGGKYQIIAGERRWQACRAIGLEKVPVRVQAVDKDKVLTLALIENLQRSDLNAMEEARGYKKLLEQDGITQTELAETVSKSRSAITNALRLLELPEEVQEALVEGKLTAGHARAILSLKNDEDRIRLADKIIQEKLSVRDAEAAAKFSGVMAAGQKGTRTAAPRVFKTTARMLRQRLSTKVSVKTVRGKNKIEIEFEDEEDLKRIIDLIG